MDTADPHHRKVDLQSPQDLAYLHANIKNIAQQKLDLHIPPSAAPPQGEDAFRTKVEELLQQYITQSLTLALPSLSINGLPATPAHLAPSDSPPLLLTTDALSSEFDPNYEPYDTRLASHLRALYATLEAETTHVASLRREAPAKAAALYAKQLKAEIGAEEGAYQGRRKIVEEQGEKVVLGGLERGEEVKVRWDGGVKGLEGLKGVTEVLAKGERAKEVAGVVEGM